MSKEYSIILNGEKIGTTLFEKADAQMGLVFGKIKNTKEGFGYDLIKNYCDSNNVELEVDEPDENLISTRTIKDLKIVDSENVEIKGVDNQISGTDDEGFDILLDGIVFSLYEKEFPLHLKSGS